MQKNKKNINGYIETLSLSYKGWVPLINNSNYSDVTNGRIIDGL